MPLTKIPFKPGINKEVTQYANEGGYYDCNLVRFRMGYAQKIGGWANTNYAANHESPSSFTFNGVTHSMTNWITAKSENLIGFGTTQGFFVQNGIGTAYHDITPIAKTASLPAGSFVTTTIGSPVITVNSPNNGLDVGTIVYFAPATGTTTSTTVDGVTIYFGNQIDGTYAYSVINVIKDSSQVEVTATGSGSVATLTGTFTIVPPPGTSITVSNMSIDGYNGVYNVITSSGTTLTYANTTTGSGVGGTVVWPTDSFQVIGTGAATVGGVAGGIALSATYLVNSGNSTTEANYAWGIGTWGLGLWGLGQPTYTTYNNRLWSQASFGDDLIFSIPGKPIYYWVKSTVNWTPAITLAQYAGTQNYQSVTTTSEAINTTTFTVEFNDYVYPGEVISFNSASPTTGSIPTGTTVLSIVGLVVTVSNPVTIPSGSILNLSYSGLYVPKQTNRLFVSPVYQFVIALGSNPYDPANANSAFNPLLVRWSDQTVPEQWIPLTSNQSGEQSLGNGSTLVTAINNLQIILVYTDTAVYQMQYVGAPYVFSFTLLQENISIISPNAAITANNVSWWMGIDKFYIYNGIVQVLPSTLRRYVFSNINKEQQWQVVAGYNEGFSEIWWFYPKGDSVECNDAIIFNFRDKKWYDAGQALGAQRSAGVFSEVFRFPVWAGNQPNVLGEYTIWQHEIGVDEVYLNNVNAIESSFETNSLGWVSGGPSSGIVPKGLNRWIRCERIEPDFVQTGEMSIIVTGKSYADDENQESDPYVFDPATLKIDMREQRREMRLKFVSNTVNGNYQMGNVLISADIGDERGTGNP